MTTTVTAAAPPAGAHGRMRTMQLEAWISVASPAVALVAAGVAIWQARAAGRQTKAAEDQVREAQRSAAAAEGQVEIMRSQHKAYLAERDERDAERHQRELAQAALVTIEMGGSSAHYGNNNDVWAVTITNHSNQPVHRPQIESMGEVPVHWGWGPVCLVDEEGGEYVLQTAEMLLPSRSTDVPYQYLDADGRPFGHAADWFFDDNSKSVRVDDVTITFSMSGAGWRRTGNREPVRLS